LMVWAPLSRMRVLGERVAVGGLGGLGRAMIVRSGSL
jgi:hypothetical protein